MTDLCPVCEQHPADTCVVIGWDSKTNRPATADHCLYCAVEGGWHDSQNHTPEEARQIADRIYSERSQ